MRYFPALVACPALTTTAAEARPAVCMFSIGNDVFLDGPCEFTAENDGSFVVGALSGGKWITYQAELTITGKGVGFGRWNGAPGRAEIDNPLGMLTRNDACWENETVRLCAW